ncbi:MAG: CPBP family intramembrane metalloprotease [Chloroflexi bacterium]|nr:CPBP family intramembrane metalloprotease [Chloroflexota bacterium]
MKKFKPFPLIVLAGIALFLALPRPLAPGYFILSFVIFGVLIGAGLYLSENAGLSPLLVHGTSRSGGLPPLILARSALIGAGLGALMLGAIRFILPSVLPEIQSRIAAESSIATWKRVVIAFDSSILEEIAFRLFLFSGLIWLAGKARHMPRPPSPQTLWAVNALIALGFGAAHLPQWSAIMPLTPSIALTVVFLNGIGGLVFGYLYFDNGLGAAMSAHFFADFVLHVIGPRFL